MSTLDRSREIRKRSQALLRESRALRAECREVASAIRGEIARAHELRDRRPTGPSPPRANPWARTPTC